MKQKSRENEYFDILSTRLREVRELKGITQAELAKMVNGRKKVKITTEKINYCELNIEGRKLQIEDLAEIAEVLNVSMDYLTGRTESMRNTTNNGLSDSTNEMIAQWGNDTLGVVDMLMQKYNNESVITDLKVYLFVTYVATNILGETIQGIEEKVKNKKDITHLESQKIAFLKDYIQYFGNQKTTFYRQVAVLADRHKTSFERAVAECENILQYNSNKDIVPDFGKLISINIALDLFRKQMRLELQDRMYISLENMVETTRNDKRFFNKIKKYFREVA